LFLASINFGEQYFVIGWPKVFFKPVCTVGQNFFRIAIEQPQAIRQIIPGIDDLPTPLGPAIMNSSGMFIFFTNILQIGPFAFPWLYKAAYKSFVF
jgi:hypothetical protein